MCGFVGYFGSDDKNLTKASSTIKHRGPDMQGISTGNGWAVAFNRLSIIDLSEMGMQPFSFDGVTVFVNGEIYNFKELRDQHFQEFVCRSGSDVEIIPFLFRKYGLEFLNKLNGMFSMVLIDEHSNTKYLIRDRYGKKPLFYKVTAKGLCFASELKALKMVTELEPDKINIGANLFCFSLIAPLTLYKNTFNVNPGSYIMHNDRGDIKEIRWYNPNIEVQSQSYENIRDNFLKLYHRSIELRLRSDVPIGIFLSGGLDSTSMASIARRLSSQDVKAFTAEIEGKAQFEKNNTDVDIPRKLCAEYDWQLVETSINFEYYNKNIVQIIENYEEIFVNSGVLVFYALAEAAKKHGVKVIFTGAGGDEIFGGYPWQAEIRSIPKPIMRHLLSTSVSKQSKWVQRLLGNWGGRYTRKLARIHKLLSQSRVWHAESISGLFQPWMPDMKGKITDRIDYHSRSYFKHAMESIKGDFYNQFNFANIFSTIASQNYMADMGCMFSSVENRSPLLDYELLEYMMSVPDTEKTSLGQKGLFRRILSEFMPDYVIQARKSGPTMPINVWLGSGALQSQASHFILDNIELIAEFVSEDLAREIKKNPCLSFSENPLPLFAILSFLIWAKCNIENYKPDYAISFTELIQNR
jgi:asparagine synthase (glutamine-hydrolysing)